MAYLYPIVRAVVYGIRYRQIKIVLFALALFVIVLITVFHYSFLVTLLLFILYVSQHLLFQMRDLSMF